MDKNYSQTKKLTISALVISLYVVILYVTQSFSFGAYQIRIATSMYALSYLFPFLVIPLGLANFIANALFGGLGILDMVGGCLVGMITSGAIVLIRKRHLPFWLSGVPILLGPGLLVPIWLSYCLHLPYKALAISLVIGQSVPSICGVLLIQIMQRVLCGRKKEGNLAK